jgi:hypothetical protein
MLKIVASLIAVLLFGVSAGAADLGVPRLVDDLAARRLYDPDRFLTVSGLTYGATRNFTLTPQVGLGYFSWGREVKTGVEESFHQIQARAGGRVELFDFLYLSAAAKLPVYSYDVTDQRLFGLATGEQASGRQQYDLFRTPGSELTWSGEVGVRLSKEVDLNLFYDLNRLGPLPVKGLLSQPEERFGTRFIFRFK